MEIDAAFLPHTHETRAAGLAGILRRLPVGRVLTAAKGTEFSLYGVETYVKK